jgi:hypothetical protein
MSIEQPLVFLLLSVRKTNPYIHDDEMNAAKGKTVKTNGSTT